MRFLAPSQLAVTVGSQVLTAPQAERVLIGSKAEWAALLSGRDKAKAAAPEHQGVWVDWVRGALYTLDGCHVLRVLVLDASAEPDLPTDGQVENYLDAATMLVASKAAGAKDSVALVRVGTSVLAASLKLGSGGRYTGPAAAPGPGEPNVVIARLPVGSVTPAKLDAVLPPSAPAFGAGMAITGYELKAGTLELAAKVAKATGTDVVYATTPASRDLPHRWDFTTADALWTIAAMGAKA